MIIELPFGEKFKLLRKKLKIPKTEIANHIGVSESTITQWELGRRVPELATFSKLLSYYDQYHPSLKIDANFFFSRKDDLNTLKKKKNGDIISIENLVDILEDLFKNFQKNYFYDGIYECSDFEFFLTHKEMQEAFYKAAQIGTVKRLFILSKEPNDFFQQIFEAHRNNHVEVRYIQKQKLPILLRVDLCIFYTYPQDPKLSDFVFQQINTSLESDLDFYEKSIFSRDEIDLLEAKSIFNRIWKQAISDFK